MCFKETASSDGKSLNHHQLIREYQELRKKLEDQVLVCQQLKRQTSRPYLMKKKGDTLKKTEIHIIKTIPDKKKEKAYRMRSRQKSRV